MRLFTPYADLDAAHRLLRGLPGITVHPHGLYAFRVTTPARAKARRLLRQAGARVSSHPTHLLVQGA